MHLGFFLRDPIRHHQDEPEKQEKVGTPLKTNTTRQKETEKHKETFSQRIP